MVACLVAGITAEPDLRAPDEFSVLFQTTVALNNNDDYVPDSSNSPPGSFVMYVRREWSPNGVDRFYTLLQPENAFYNDNGFFRVVEDFVVQWGINGDPAVNAEWDDPIPDDPVVKSNTKGWVTFATSGPNTRTTQLYINYDDNSYLDDMGFSPFAFVVSGWNVVESIYSGYGEEPLQPLIQTQGNSYLHENFPDLDYIIEASIMHNSTISYYSGAASNATSSEGGDRGSSADLTLLIALGSVLVGMSCLCVILICAVCVFAVMACHQAKDGYVNTSIQDDFGH